MNYLMGVDLGQAADFTAICILERQVPGPRPLDTYAQRRGERPTAEPAHYHGRHLERVQIGTPYPVIVERVAAMLQTPQLRGATDLVVDATGVGRPVVDMMHRAGLDPISVTIHGGDAVSRDGTGYRVPKRDLVGAVQVLLQTERLKFAAELRDVPTLVSELQNFRVKINLNTAHDSYAAHRERDHDDLVLAVAVAAWYAERTGRRMADLDPASYPPLRF
ncbi:MAG: hypothetical protein M3418_05280 [Gemmatimonadota bacterium]|nr:hypothetical protein [Gemmatimonadota bacterium]